MRTKTVRSKIMALKKESAFRVDLGGLINYHSKENASDTPDFILARFLTDCLEAFDRTIKSRTEWKEN